MTTWRKGPPPSVGWWPTQATDVTGTYSGLRWWNGYRWSVRVEEHEVIVRSDADLFANVETAWDAEAIEWTDRPANWPKRSKT